MGMILKQSDSLLTFFLLIREDFWVFLSFPSDRSLFSALVGVYKNTVIAENQGSNKRCFLNGVFQSGALRGL